MDYHIRRLKRAGTGWKTCIRVEERVSRVEEQVREGKELQYRRVLAILISYFQGSGAEARHENAKHSRLIL